MIDRIVGARMLTVAAMVLTLLPAAVRAQGGRRAVGRSVAPVDLTGYWVSVVTEDWRFRMVTPPKGDYQSVPLNAEGKRVADLWDPVKDEESGQQCKSYGAPAVMRIPGRLHITWENDNTLRVDTDAGTQTRLFHFQESSPVIVSGTGGQRVEGGASTSAVIPRGEPTWQGYSMATWEFATDGDGRPIIPASGPAGPAATPTGDLKVITTQLRPGYLRKNGVPYSANAIVTEYFARTNEDNGDSWLIVTTMVDDPQYLNAPFVTSTHFKKQADASGWSPSTCSAK